MISKKLRILAVFSDVNFSPQLIAILQKLNDCGAEIRVVLIGNTELEIAKQIRLRGWDSQIIAQRGKYGSVLNLLLLSLEIIKFRPQTLFASGQFATILGMLSAKILNVPHRVFIRHHSILHHKYNMKLGLVIDHTSNRLATNIVAVSMVVKNILIEYESVNQNKIILIHNGVDLSEFKSKQHLPKEPSTRTIVNSRVFHIGVISRLTQWKGVEYVAKAFVRLQEEFPNSLLHIVGAFSDSYTNVKNILSAADSNRYVLEPSNCNIPLFLHGLDAFVHVPVGIDDEAFGIVYIEALASRIPCVFTRSGVLNELESPELFAHLVAYRNSEEIYMNLARLIQGMHDSKIAVPESWLNQFSLEKMTNDYAKLLLRESL